MPEEQNSIWQQSSSENPRDYQVALILALGISGVTICVFCAPFAWFMGAFALRDMERDGIFDGWERTLVQVALYLGMIGTAVFSVGICLFFLIKGLR